MVYERVYRFSVVLHSNLSVGDPEDPFRFHQQGQNTPFKSYPKKTKIVFEVVDVDQNRTINKEDRFFFYSSDGKRKPLAPEIGLKLLNYYADPAVLRKSGLGLVVRSSEEDREREPPLQPFTSLESLGLDSSQRKEIFENHFPYWEAEGHVDLDILQGLRIYTDEENNRWTGIRGIPIFFNGKYFLKRGLLEKGAVAAGFMLGEHVFNSAFMWHMYTTNFISMVAGSRLQNSRYKGQIETDEVISNSPYSNSNIKRLANIRTAQARAKIAEDNLYWILTWPVVAAACVADPNFRRVVRNPLVPIRYFASQFSTAFSAIGKSPAACLKNPFGLGALLLAGKGIYDVSSRWFDVYGNLKRGSIENKIFSGASTILTEAALIARVSREMHSLTGSGALSWSNFMQLRSMPYSWGFEAQMGRMNLFGLKVPMPQVGFVARYTPQALGVGASEAFLGRAALPAAGEALAGVARFVPAVSRIRVIGLPLLGIAIGVGLLFGIGYATGILGGDRESRGFFS
jgi:hypothetical protein